VKYARPTRLSESDGGQTSPQYHLPAFYGELPQINSPAGFTRHRMAASSTDAAGKIYWILLSCLLLKAVLKKH